MNNNQDNIRMAPVVLAKKLRVIHNTKDWALLMGYRSLETFSRHYFRRFHIRPGQALKTTRLNHILYLILFRPKLSGYEIAWESGLVDEKALHGFLTYHIGKNLTEIREYLRPPKIE
jgi:hypothetical protein